MLKYGNVEQWNRVQCMRIYQMKHEHEAVKNEKWNDVKLVSNKFNFWNI